MGATFNWVVYIAPPQRMLTLPEQLKTKQKKHNKIQKKKIKNFS